MERILFIQCNYSFSRFITLPILSLSPHVSPNYEVIIMKFIISTFSPSMFIEHDFDLRWHKLTEDEFQALSYDAYSCVGYPDVATMLNVAHNREPVKARVGDILLLAQMNSNGHLEYYCIQVCPSEFPLLREDEYLVDEEMI